MLGGVGADWSQMTAALSAGEGSGNAPRTARDVKDPVDAQSRSTAGGARSSLWVLQIPSPGL